MPWDQSWTWPERWYKRRVIPVLIASFVPFDSWFAFPSFVHEVYDIGYHVICKLKDLPTIHYISKGKRCPLGVLYRKCGKDDFKPLLHILGRCASIVVATKQGLQVRIVFYREDKSSRWSAFLSTDLERSPEEVLMTYKTSKEQSSQSFSQQIIWLRRFDLNLPISIGIVMKFQYIGLDEPASASWISGWVVTLVVIIYTWHELFFLDQSFSERRFMWINTIQPFDAFALSFSIPKSDPFSYTYSRYFLSLALYMIPRGISIIYLSLLRCPFCF